MSATVIAHSTTECVNNRFLTGKSGMKFCSKFLKDHSGATAIEYGLIAAGISTAIIVSVYTLGPTLDGTLSFVNTEMNSQ